jgi:3-oxoacyl-[acyl-carrier protein] reductase
MIFNNYKVAITGATSGIGLAAAKEFIKEGATVIGIGRNFEKTADLGDKFIPFKCDVRNENEIIGACKFINKTFNGKLDVFVNNAGLGSNTPLVNMTHEAFTNAIGLLLEAPVLFSAKLYPLLLKSENGDPNIVITASLASRSFDEPFLYCLGKAGAVHFTKLAANILRGVRVNSVSPGVIKTPIFTREGTEVPPEAMADFYKARAQNNPLKRVAEPEEAAGLICFLASKNAAYINGSDVLIDGGMSLKL